MAKCAACGKEVRESELYKGWCADCVEEVQDTARRRAEEG